MKKRIGIFGGTFNPIHLGHVKACLEVQKVFALDTILFIPSYIPPHKGSSDIAAPSHRMKMVELAVADYPQFIPSSIEIEAKGKSYSILTLSKLRARYPRAWIFFILGVDAFIEIDSWRDYRKVLEQCHFIVISRPGYHIKDAENILGGKYKKWILRLSAQEEINEEMIIRYKIFLLPISALNVASHEVRKRIKNKESISRRVAEPVEAYIIKNKLYQ
jgi:nicotinate-nucleotide adenylyltransferase